MLKCSVPEVCGAGVEPAEGDSTAFEVGAGVEPATGDDSTTGEATLGDSGE